MSAAVGKVEQLQSRVTAVPTEARSKPTGEPIQE